MAAIIYNLNTYCIRYEFNNSKSYTHLLIYSYAAKGDETLDCQRSGYDLCLGLGSRFIQSGFNIAHAWQVARADRHHPTYICHKVCTFTPISFSSHGHCVDASEQNLWAE